MKVAQKAKSGFCVNVVKGVGHSTFVPPLAPDMLHLALETAGATHGTFSYQVTGHYSALRSSSIYVMSVSSARGKDLRVQMKCGKSSDSTLSGILRIPPTVNFLEMFDGLKKAVDSLNSESWKKLGEKSADPEGGIQTEAIQGFMGDPVSEAPTHKGEESSFMEVHGTISTDGASVPLEETLADPVSPSFPSRYTKGWFSDTVLVKTLLSSLLEKFFADRVAIRTDLTQWLKGVTKFERPIDVGLLIRQLILHEFIEPGPLQGNGKKSEYYRLNKERIQQFLQGDDRVPVVEPNPDDGSWKVPLIRHWKNPERLRKALLSICEGYPDDRVASAVGLTKYAASIEGLTFENKLVRVIPELLVSMGFVSLYFDGGATRYTLHRERIGMYLATGKLVKEKLATEVAAVPVPAPVAVSAPQDPLQMLRAQYDQLVAPLEEAGRQKVLLEEKLSGIKAEMMRITEERQKLDDMLVSLSTESESAQGALMEQQHLYETLEATVDPILREKLTKIMKILAE